MLSRRSFEPMLGNASVKQQEVLGARSLRPALVLMIVLSGLMPGSAYAVATGPNSPTSAQSVANPGSFGPAWSVPTNVFASDSSEAEFNPGNGIGYSQWLQAGGFGFQIPEDATIDRIVVEVQRRSNQPNTYEDDGVVLLKGNAIVGTSKTAGVWPSGAAGTTDYQSYGEGSDPLWGTTWTAEEINQGLGIALSARKIVTPASRRAYVDHIRITVHYTPPATDYTLTYTAGTGGSITGTSPQTVAYGSDGTEVTAVPDTGYQFTSWSDGVTTAARTDTNITADLSVTANFAPLTYTLTYTAGTGGTISGTSPQTVAYGGSGTPVMAVANTGYDFVSWSDGVTTAMRTDTLVMADVDVTAIFAIKTYTLTYTAGTGGSITGTARRPSPTAQTVPRSPRCLIPATSSRAGLTESRPQPGPTRTSPPICPSPPTSPR
jgi:hypothetical protein